MTKMTKKIRVKLTKASFLSRFSRVFSSCSRSKQRIHKRAACHFALSFRTHCLHRYRLWNGWVCCEVVLHEGSGMDDCTPAAPAQYKDYQWEKIVRKCDGKFLKWQLSRFPVAELLGIVNWASSIDDCKFLNTVQKVVELSTGKTVKYLTFSCGFGGDAHACDGCHVKSDTDADQHAGDARDPLAP
jgi:hypothetical protein